MLPDERRGLSPYMTIYRVLDEVGSRMPGAVPPGVSCVVHDAIDALRRDDAPAEDIAVAERIAIALHKLHWAALGHQIDEADHAWGELTALSEQWLTRPLTLH